MALPVLDGNQSATTLSSVVTGGEHIVAHSVVSLGTTAIANITSAVSGAVVTIPALSHLGNSVATDGVADATTNFVKIGGHQSGSNQTAHIVHVSTGGAMSVDATDSVVSISNFPSTQTIAGTVTANLSKLASHASTITKADNQIQIIGGYSGGSPSNATAYPIGIDSSGNISSRLYWSGIGAQPTEVATASPLPVQVVSQGSVTIGSLPAISGTVTANLNSVVTINSDGASFSQRVVSKSALQFTAIAGAIDPTKFSSNYTVLPVKITSETDGLNLAVDLRKTFQGNDLSAISNDSAAAFVRTQVVGGSVTIGSLPAISGTVTANTAYEKYANIYQSPPSNAVQLGFADSGNFFVNVRHNNGLPVRQQEGSSVTIGSLPAISGTVTANVLNTTVTVSSFPRPTWTDYSGSVATANSAVTAISTVTRSYLLAQVTTGQMFLNIGATCTTGNGVYFSAGQGFAWETAVPQGIVSIISSVTGTNYVLKDG